MTDHEPPSDVDRVEISRRARAFFEELWVDSDPWALERSELDRRRFERQVALLGDRRYRRALEIGCATGTFTRRLAPLCDELVALDISEDAVSHGEAAAGAARSVEYMVANIMDLDLEQHGTWDLVVLSETLYYLGWLYPMFDVAWLAHSLYESTDEGGRLLLVNTISTERGIMSRWLIRTYRDLFLNVGYVPETEEQLRGIKETVEFEIELALLQKHRA